LIDTLRLLIDESGQPAVGVEHGGMHSAEALLIARYFMYTQVYFHKVRAIYDLHLIDFLKEWLEGGRFKAEAEDHLRMTDNEVLAAMVLASVDENAPGHRPASLIMNRRHFKLVYERTRPDAEVLLKPEVAIFDALSRSSVRSRCGTSRVRTQTRPLTSRCRPPRV
jgi:HD superfamily phosphohydrolase